LIATTNHYRQLWMMQATARVFLFFHLHHHHRWFVCSLRHHRQSR
jgi:hypothetical protein